MSPTVFRPTGSNRDHRTQTGSQSPLRTVTGYVTELSASSSRTCSAGAWSYAWTFGSISDLNFGISGFHFGINSNGWQFVTTCIGYTGKAICGLGSGVDSTLSFGSVVDAVSASRLVCLRLAYPHS